MPCKIRLTSITAVLKVRTKRRAGITFDAVEPSQSVTPPLQPFPPPPAVDDDELSFGIAVDVAKVVERIRAEVVGRAPRRVTRSLRAP